MRQRCSYRINFEASRVQCPAEPTNDSTLARGIPSFEDNNRPFSGLEICLLDRLHDELHRLQPALIICKPNGGMPGGFGQCGTFDDNKILGLHTQSLIASPFRFALIEIKRDRACSQAGRRLRSTAPDQRCPQRRLSPRLRKYHRTAANVEKRHKRS
jgi:hypothetical protein